MRGVSACGQNTVSGTETQETTEGGQVYSRNKVSTQQTKSTRTILLQGQFGQKYRISRAFDSAIVLQLTALVQSVIRRSWFSCSKWKIQAEHVDGVR
jgi:hypothetical protein